MPDQTVPATPATGAPTSAPKKLTGVETLKLNSLGLRGRLAEELAEGGIQVSEDAYNLLKFHGSYEQFDRDTATERKQRKLEKEYQFMVRVRMPGGMLTADQYLALDKLADDYANGTLRITTRQGIQFHGVLKADLKPTIAAINHTLLTTMSACGDVVRNVMTTAAPRRDARHLRLQDDARLLSTALLPKSRGYYQIFLDEEPVAGFDEHDPLYGDTYLPRKFKIGLATPEDNSADVLANDLAFIAVFDEADTLLGYNVAIGGGLGMTHNRADTFPRLASPICFVGPDELENAARWVVSLHRDHGGRTDRKRARLKYVVKDHGLPWCKQQLDTYAGRALDPPRPTDRLHIPELLGWHEQGDGLWWLGVPVPSGRIGDSETSTLRTALREIVERFRVDPVMTAQQDVLLSNVRPEHKDEIDRILAEHRVVPAGALSTFERFALACPALPTCGLALTEAERVREPIVASLDSILRGHGLQDRRISLRITGCPNGCARSYSGDIGLVGRIPGHYAIYVGGDFDGHSLSFRLLERVPEARLGEAFAPLFAGWAEQGLEDEGFGPFCSRLGRDALLAMIGAPDGALPKPQ
ncbi:NADPH-dependent assimilatory sulfite reductase hemoprotein subunit [Acetobacteraceae bacterium KSS8]|uniref:NADPH-dependent assimilatory sulfite reductase hemoprotein subunit n=1 Tax=Endosaccharibacter trunci TaxID=2812733 RepID=A0ABT1W9B5_9PROT|nr:NADPH-dependent assimilatory sulfite reductase hemoprotein subunit [Acetobacteraceae bacterium KSS8]